MAFFGRKIRSGSPTSGHGDSIGSTLWRLARLLIGVGIVFLLWRQVTKGADAGWQLTSLRPIPSILCVGLMLPNVFLELTAWRMLLNGAGLRLSFGQALPAVLAGFTAGAISPGGVGDFVGRVIRMRPADRWLTGVAMALARVADGIAVCAIGLPAAYFLARDTTATVAAWTKSVMGVGVLVLIVLLAVFIGRDYNVRAKWLGDRLKNLREAVNVSARIPGTIRLRVLSVSFLRYSVFVAQLCIAVVAIGGAQSVTLPMALAASTVFLMRSIAPPITFMGLGVREAAAVAIFPLVGVPGPEALVASLLVFASNLLLPALIGVPFLLFPEWRINEPEGDAP